MVKQRLGDSGVMLVAVGAVHLGCDGSLIDLLAKLGIRARRISRTKAAKPRAKFLPTPANWRDCDGYMFGLRTPIAGVD